MGYLCAATVERKREEEREMKMAALSVLSQPPPSFSYCFNSNNNNNNSFKCKLHSFSYSHHFNSLSSLSATNKPSPPPKQFPVPTQFSKSGKNSFFLFNIHILSQFQFNLPFMDIATFILNNSLLHYNGVYSAREICSILLRWKYYSSIGWVLVEDFSPFHFSNFPES